MTPTREDLIQMLTMYSQLGVTMLASTFNADASAILSVLKTGDDFEPCAPRAQDGQGFAWRLSSLAVDPRVRAAAFVHQRSVERPPQLRQFHNTGVARVQPTKHLEGANVLVAWMRENPGKWTLDQIAQGRGCTVAAVRSLLRIHRQCFTEERLPTKGRPVVLSLKPHLAA
jgi:hypothetical protein